MKKGTHFKGHGRRANALIKQICAERRVSSESLAIMANIPKKRIDSIFALGSPLKRDEIAPICEALNLNTAMVAILAVSDMGYKPLQNKDIERIENVFCLINDVDCAYTNKRIYF